MTPARAAAIVADVMARLGDWSAGAGAEAPPAPARPVDPLAAWRPDPAWWAHDPAGLHGVGHAARVLTWADQVAAGLEAAGVAVDRAVVCAAAILHDCRRHNDGADPAHGLRAAAWILRAQGTVLPRLTPDQVEQVAHCVMWHVPPDSACPAMTPELQCLKDGDSLDRVRLGDFDARYLRTAHLVGEEARAQRLWAETRDAPAEAAWDAVRTAARALGLWNH